MVIAATWELGEAVVSGLVVPDHIVIGPDGQVFEYLIGEKHVMVIPGRKPGEGVREVSVPRMLRGMPVLSVSQAMAVGVAARDLSRRLGFEADLEGAFAGGTLYLLQARPITTLLPRREQGSRLAPSGAINGGTHGGRAAGACTARSNDSWPQR